MHNRAPILEENFQKAAELGFFSENLKSKDFWQEELQKNLSRENFLDLLESQMMSRILDFKSRELRAEGKSFYTIGSSGHEGNAALAYALKKDDMAFLHYRSGAFYIQRAKMWDGATPLYDMLCSFTMATKDPISGGRHKVIGSKKYFIPPQTSTIASHLPKAVGAALSIPRAQQLSVEGPLDEKGIVVCNFGDASFNHSTALGAINCAQWISYQNLPLPLLFVCEDNGMGISVPTPQNWIRENVKNRVGLKYFYCNGRNIIDVVRTSRAAAHYVRSTKKPAFLHMRTVRLMGHAGSDIEANYLSLSRIVDTEKKDPLLKTCQLAVALDIATSDELLKIYKSLRDRVEAISIKVKDYPQLETSADIASSLISSEQINLSPAKLNNIQRKDLFESDWKQMEFPQTLGRQINWALTDIMAQYKNTVVFGEDVGKKGGVYNVTNKLQKRFGQKRVFNSLLDEQSILGNAIGMAHNGFLPIPEIQFLAYVHNAEDQIRGEAATLSYFSNAQFQNPMVIRIAGLGYQKGFGGHFHNDNSLAVFRDIPGLIIACPSRPADAPAMLKTCVQLAHEEGRVVVFLEPIALYNVRDLYEPGDGLWTQKYPDPDKASKIELGEFGVDQLRGQNTDLCLISYGNGHLLSCQAAKDFQELTGCSVKVIDLRWLSDIDEDSLSKEAALSKAVLIVDECRKTGSQSEALMAMLLEQCEELPFISRYCGDDCFVPTGPASELIMPTREGIVFHLQDLLDKIQGGEDGGQ